MHIRTFLLAGAVTASLLAAPAQAAPVPAALLPAGPVTANATAADVPVSFEASAPKPNILLINTDDQRWDTMRVMPKTMKWLKNARGFDRATVSIPSCCPSRSGLISGRYPHNNKVRHQDDAPNMDMSTTMPVLLRKAGYHTAMAGKFLNSWPLDSPPPGFDHYSAMHGGYQGFKTFTDNKLEWVNAYSTTWYANRLKGWISGFDAADTKPWFAYYAPYAPHRPSTPEAKYKNASVGSCLQPGEADVNDKPAWLKWTKPDTKLADQVCHDQLRTLLSVDDSVDLLLSDLDKRGELSHTLVAFTSDNGYLWGEHNRIEKFVGYLPSLRVPLLLRWDGHVTAGVDHRMTNQLDITATLLAAAGVTLPKNHLDGRSLLGPARTGYILSEYWLDTKNSRVPDWGMLWNGSVQYIENYDQGKLTFKELYHTDTDPGELTNVLHGQVSAADQQLANQLHDQLTAARSCAGSTCP
ncbi:sulfatase family protein [Hamadaea tsunoensis]|uniref:sulfatase family protein n=1 Tax=Hamadaea tsunoensis TaxID=53368 RepID=UPI0004290768|nr:sulfatase [Hamadaea tsunoensis]